MKRFLVAIIVVMFVPTDGAAQIINPMVGLTSVDAGVEVTWDDGITRVSENNYTRQFRDAFRLAIMRAGLSVDQDAPNLFTYSLVVLPATDEATLIAMGWKIALTELATYRGQRQFVDTWSTFGVWTMGQNNLDARQDAIDCAEAFELEWRRANN